MLNSPFKQMPGPSEAKAIPGKNLGPELDSYAHNASIPVGESIMGSPDGAKSGINTPFDQAIAQKPHSVKGRKNP